MGRSKHNQIIRHLPITYIINKLVSTDNFSASIVFERKNGQIDLEQFRILQKNFLESFEILTPHQKSLFLQNVTGNQYYSDTVTIVFAYSKKNQQYSQTSDQPFNQTEPGSIMEYLTDDGTDQESDDDTYSQHSHAIDIDFSDIYLTDEQRIQMGLLPHESSVATYDSSSMPESNLLAESIFGPEST